MICVIKIHISINTEIAEVIFAQKLKKEDKILRYDRLTLIIFFWLLNITSLI